MNLLEILHARIASLPEGDYMQGLKAVLQHIEVAGRHLERGHTDADDTAFTDAIYRTNQAFEGSLKEAFRVLTATDPARESPNSIEKHLQQQNVLRPRVVAQLTNYRTEWRNPSTHDYRLDFDEDEALLAIVTVSAFAIVLIDQITERISFERAKTVASEQPSPSPPDQSLLEQVAALLEEFTIQFNQTRADRTDVREVEIIGALAGFLTAAAPELKVQPHTLETDRMFPADFHIASEEEGLMLEVKRGRRWSASTKEDASHQIIKYMQMSAITQAILFFYASPNHGRVVRAEPLEPFPGARLLIISAE